MATYDDLPVDVRVLARGDLTDHEFLAWLADRLVFVYHENPNSDFVLRLRRIVGFPPKLCGARTGATGMFVCTQPVGHDGNHFMDGDNLSMSWSQVT